jgi:hypothetical protein
LLTAGWPRFDAGTLLRRTPLIATTTPSTATAASAVLATISAIAIEATTLHRRWSLRARLARGRGWRLARGSGTRLGAIAVTLAIALCVPAVIPRRSIAALIAIAAFESPLTVVTRTFAMAIVAIMTIARLKAIGPFMSSAVASATVLALSSVRSRGSI